MKKEELFEALADMDPASVERARTYQAGKKPIWIRWTALAACVALLAGAILGIPALRQGRYSAGLQVVLAAYPAPTAAGMNAGKFMESDAHWDWWNTYRMHVQKTEALQSDLAAYNAALLARLLPAEDENTVCSPLNIYLAFAMLAEISEGNTRQQILDVLGAADVETLRETVAALWQSNLVDTPALKSLLANSLWLSDSVDYREDTLRRLAEDYYASAFRGTPGGDAMDQALRKWTNDNTGGLLSEYTEGMSIAPDTVLELLSTIYYQAMWQEEFREGNTTSETFHGTKGDTSVDMMHRTDSMTVYRTDNFTALGLSLTDSGAMYFLLPEEGVDVNALAADPELLQAIRYDPENEAWSFPLVHLSVPKFRVSARTDLLETVEALGIRDALDPALADFSPLTAEDSSVALTKAEHAAMLEIDEHGVKGAAYTELALTEGAAEPEDEINFVLDRPFLFLVTARDGSLLFSGVVRNID